MAGNGVVEVEQQKVEAPLPRRSNARCRRGWSRARSEVDGVEVFDFLPAPVHVKLERIATEALNRTAFDGADVDRNLDQFDGQLFADLCAAGRDSECGENDECRDAHHVPRDAIVSNSPPDAPLSQSARHWRGPLPRAAASMAPACRARRESGSERRGIRTLPPG